MSSFIGIDPNGLNQVSSSVISLYVSGSPVISASPNSISIVNAIPFSASKIETSIIDTPASETLTINANTLITGSVSASIFRGDGSGLFNIQADSIGDINRIKSGSAVAQISPNNGLVVNVPTNISGGLTLTGNANVTGNANIIGNINVSGKITSTEISTTFISSSVIYSSGSNKFGDATSDRQEITGSLNISGSIFVGTPDTIPTDNTTNEVLVLNTTTGRVSRRFAAATSLLLREHFTEQNI